MQDALSSAAIYYTLDGTAPTASSTLYSGPITLQPDAVINAIAVASGYTTSAVATVTYSDTTTTLLNYSSGAFTSTGVTLNGATVTNNYLQLTDGNANEAHSAWSSTKLPVSSFRSSFTFQLLNAEADGFTFSIQNAGSSAVGANGDGLGYRGIGKSVAIKFDLYNNAGEGPDSTGLYINGAMPTVPSVDLTNTGIDLHSGDIMSAQLDYDGTALVMTLTDTATGAMTTLSFPVNIPGVVGADTAYVGFTGGTGGETASQNILSWSYSH
jgi:hypothetical protein